MMEVPASCCLLSALATQALVLRLLSHSGLFSINYFRNNNNKNGINFASRVPCAPPVRRQVRCDRSRSPPSPWLNRRRIKP